MVAALNNMEWQIRPPARACARCAKEFADGQAIRSRLLFAEGEGYRREDICEGCLTAADTAEVFSWWRGTFRRPPPPPPEPVKKETAESLLRKLIEEGAAERAGAIFVLSVMLERRRVLMEREVRIHEDGGRIRIYEHRGTGESFVIRDPGLRLDDLERVQAEVIALLGGGEKSEASAEPTTNGAGGGGAERSEKQ